MPPARTDRAAHDCHMPAGPHQADQMGQEGVGRVLMHQHQATVDRIERDISLIGKPVGLDHVDPGR